VGLNQPLAGRIEPTARSWRDARPADRLAFYKAAGEAAVRLKRAELARAIGSNGRRMQPRKRPRPDGADGPVLTPHGEASRTARLLAARASAGGVTLFWHSGIGKAHRTPWGTILGFHAAGQVKGAPVRDARLSARGVNAVRAEMTTWWTRRVAARDRREEDARRQTTAPRRGLAAKARAAIVAAQVALVGKYRSLRGYFRTPGQGI